ncbi:unnamed protein product [Diamesa hyperborea]
MYKLAVILCCFSASIQNSNAFWSLDSDLQFGFQVYDLANDINANIQAASTAAARNYIVQTDDNVRSCVRGLSSIATQLRSAPIAFFNELNYAASSRTNTEIWHIGRLRPLFTAHLNSLNVLLNSTGPLNDVSNVASPAITSRIRLYLLVVLEESNKLMVNLEAMTRDVSMVRNNVTTDLTPEFIHTFLNPKTINETIRSLSNIRDALIVLKSGILDTARLAVAQGSIYEAFQRRSTRDTTLSTTSLNTFKNNFVRVRNNLIATVTQNRQSADSGFLNFIRRVQNAYEDNIVRPTFEDEQLPYIKNFNDIIVSRVYNQSLFELSFDNMRDSIVQTYNEHAGSYSLQNVQFRDQVLDLQRREFVQLYSPCLNELVSQAQEHSSAVAKKYVLCLNERNSAILVIIPSTSTWMSVIRDTINSITSQLNSCITGATSFSGRTAVSECIQSTIGMLPFYSRYLAETVEANLKPIVESSPMIFEFCINNIVAENKKFNALFNNCSNEASPLTPTTPNYTTSTPSYELL